MSSSIKQLPSNYPPIKISELNNWLNFELKINELPNNKLIKLKENSNDNSINFDFISKYEFNNMDYASLQQLNLIRNSLKTKKNCLNLKAKLNDYPILPHNIEFELNEVPQIGFNTYLKQMKLKKLELIKLKNELKLELKAKLNSVNEKEVKLKQIKKEMEKSKLKQIIKNHTKRQTNFELINDYKAPLIKSISTTSGANDRKSNLKDRIELICNELMLLNINPNSNNQELILNTIKSIKQDQLPLHLLNQLTNKLNFNLIKLRLNYYLKFGDIKSNYNTEVEEYAIIKEAKKQGNRNKFNNLREYLNFIKNSLNQKFLEFESINQQLEVLQPQIELKLKNYKNQLNVKSEKMEKIAKLLFIKLKTNLNQINIEKELKLIDLKDDRKFEFDIELANIKELKDELIIKESLINRLLLQNQDNLKLIEFQLDEINKLKSQIINNNLNGLKFNFKKFEGIIVKEFNLINLIEFENNIKDNNINIELVKSELDEIVNLNFKKFLSNQQLKNNNLMTNEIETNYTQLLQNNIDLTNNNSNNSINLNTLISCLINEYKAKRNEINSLHGKFNKNNLELVKEAKVNYENLAEVLNLRDFVAELIQIDI